MCVCVFIIFLNPVCLISLHCRVYLSIYNTQIFCELYFQCLMMICNFQSQRRSGGNIDPNEVDLSVTKVFPQNKWVWLNTAWTACLLSHEKKMRSLFSMSENVSTYNHHRVLFYRHWKEYLIVKKLSSSHVSWMFLYEWNPFFDAWENAEAIVKCLMIILVWPWGIMYLRTQNC